MPHPHPTAFLGTPALHPSPTPAAAWLPSTLPLPPALDLTARLTVRPTGDVTLTKPLLAAVAHLRAGAPVDVVPPAQRGGLWHLDTRPTAARRVRASHHVARLRIAPPSAQHFLIPAMPAAPGHKGGAQGTAGRRPVLHFVLGVQVDGAPGYYELRPLRP